MMKTVVIMLLVMILKKALMLILLLMRKMEICNSDVVAAEDEDGYYADYDEDAKLCRHKSDTAVSGKKKKHGFDAAHVAAEAHTKLDGAGSVDNRPSTD